MKSITGFIRYRFKLYYSSLRCLFTGGTFVYSINKKVKFVCNQKDDFSKVIYISNGHEKYEMKWCSSFLEHLPSDSTIIDCGANIGYFSCYLSQTNPQHRFTAIEGNPKTFEILNNHLQLLKLKNITSKNAILAESTEKFYKISDRPGREPWQQATEITHSEIESLTLNNLINKTGSPDFIKIDCEGFEVKILKGADPILQNGKTVFFIECNDDALIKAGNSRKELFNILLKHNYHLFHLSSFDQKLDPGIEISIDFPSKEFNFVAVPQNEKLLNATKEVFSKLKP